MAQYNDSISRVLLQKKINEKNLLFHSGQLLCSRLIISTQRVG